MRVALIAVALVALTGCGFKPMYAPSAGGEATIGAVDVPEVPGKAGHAFRTELTRMLDAEARGSSATPRRLEVNMAEKVNALGLRVDESATRADLILTADYKLFDLNGEEMVKGKVTAVAAYDIPVQAYGAAAAQDDARERAGVLLAENLRTDLALQLVRLRRDGPRRPATAILPK